MEKIVLDPSEFIEGRTELSLAELGLEVGEKGADYGESQVEVQLARQVIGESVTNRHLSNVTMTIPLRVQAESGVSLADAAYRLQQKVALWQAEGGWLRRDFSEDGEFAGSVGYRILTANLSGLQGWLMAHRQVAPEVTLKLIREPLCYSVAELEDTAASAEGELVETMEALVGTSPGLIRYRLKNENESAAWRGLIFAAESRDYPETGADTTAALSYEAKALTLKGGSSEAERESKKVVRNTALSAGWLTILDSKITASGHMTHRGVRRVFARVYHPEDTTGNVQLRLLWRPLGTLSWSENEIVTPKVTSAWTIVDLGEARPEIAALGEERWEWQIQARALSGLGSIDIHKVWPLPTEQLQILTAPGSTLSAELQSAKAPGAVENLSLFGGEEWKTAENAKTSDNTYAEVTLPSGSHSKLLFAHTFGFALPETAIVLGVVAGVERHATSKTIGDEWVSLVKGGAVGPPGEGGKFFGWPTSDEVAIYGGSSNLWGETLTATDVNNPEFGLSLSVVNGGASATAKVDAITLTVYYSEAQDENRIAFATRSVELRSDGTYRQHPSEEIWGSMIPAEGSFCPTAPVSGLEGRKARFIAIPTQGDLGEVADSGTNKLSATIFRRPAYLFAREAA